MTTNMIYFKMLFPNCFRVRKKKSEVLKKPLVFYLICDLVDAETVYEIKYVCKKFQELVKDKDNIDNKALKIQIKRMKNKIEPCDESKYIPLKKPNVVIRLDFESMLDSYLNTFRQIRKEEVVLKPSQIYSMEGEIPDCFKLPCEEEGLVDKLLSTKKENKQVIKKEESDLKKEYERIIKNMTFQDKFQLYSFFYARKIFQIQRKTEDFIQRAGKAINSIDKALIVKLDYKLCQYFFSYDDR